MDIESLEARLAKLEKEHATLHARFVAALRTEGAHARELTALEIKVQSLEARLKDLDQVEAAAYAAYGKTHEATKTGFDAMNEAIETARDDIHFSSLPTVQDYYKRHKKPPES
jgi:chromosome segregation ATPase